MAEERLPEELRAALDAYRSARTAASWTKLSQLSVGDVDVLDAVQSIDPNFPDPLPVPADGLIEDSDEFYEWSVLPDPDDVQRAIMRALQRVK
jgi:hypothetical protein